MRATRRGDSVPVHQVRIRPSPHRAEPAGLQDILRKKAADEHELERKLRELHRAAAAAEPMEEEDDWEVSYHMNETGEKSSTNPCHPAGTPSGAPASVKSPRDGSMISYSSSEEYPEDDD